jgi:hypothetical protein
MNMANNKNEFNPDRMDLQQYYSAAKKLTDEQIKQLNAIANVFKSYGTRAKQQEYAGIHKTVRDVNTTKLGMNRVQTSQESPLARLFCCVPTSGK